MAVSPRILDTRSGLSLHALVRTRSIRLRVMACSRIEIRRLVSYEPRALPYDAHSARRMRGHEEISLRRIL